MLGPPDLAMQRRRQPESRRARTTGTGWCCKPSLSSAEGWQGIGDRCLFHDCSSLFVPSLSFLGLETVPDYSGGLAVRKASDVPLPLPIFASPGKIFPPSHSSQARHIPNTRPAIYDQRFVISPGPDPSDRSRFNNRNRKRSLSIKKFAVSATMHANGGACLQWNSLTGHPGRPRLVMQVGQFACAPRVRHPQYRTSFLDTHTRHPRKRTAI